MMMMAMMVPAFADTVDREVTITYNAGTGGTRTGASDYTDSVIVKANSDYEWYELVSPTTAGVSNAGKVFKGWGMATNATQTVDRLLVKDTDYTNGITVYAIWADDMNSSGNNQSLNLTTGSITINNSAKDEAYNAYQLFELFSWSDDNTSPDSHTADKEAYSYYIDTTHPLYSTLRDYTYTTGKKMFDFDTEHNNTTIRSGKTLTPVHLSKDYLTTIGGLTSTTYDENTEGEYQAASNAYVQAFAQYILDQILNHTNSDGQAAIKKGTVNGNGGAATINNLPFGYYIVDSTLGSLCACDTTNPAVTIVEKNELTQVEKKVKEDGGSETTDDLGDKNDADFGQTVQFTSTVVIPLRQSNVVYHDKINTTAFKLTKLEVKVGGSNMDTNFFTIYEDQTTPAFTASTAPKASVAFPESSDANYHADYATDTFAIAFTNTHTEGLTAAETVTITYEATLLTTATIGLQSGTAAGSGNDNQAWVTYGKAQKSEVDWTRTYTWEYNLFKYAKHSTKVVKKKSDYASAEAAALKGFIQNAGMESQEQDPTDYWIQVNPLGGAVFNVKKGDDTLSFVRTTTGDADTASVYRLAVAEDASNTKTANIETPASGLVNIEGLDADTYVLTEITAPTGYDKLSADVTFVLDSDTNDAQDDNNGGQAVEEFNVKMNNVAVDQINIENITGTELPSTGGMGTTVLYIVGGMLVILAGAYLFFSRKKTA